MKRQAERIVVAAARWVDAVNAPREPTRLRDACAADVVVERFGVFDKEGKLAETFRGLAAVSAWLDRLPEGIFFELTGSPEPAPEGGPATWAIRYIYRIPDLQFEGGGDWWLRLDDAGRVAWLRHDPDPLPDAMSAGGRDQGGHRHGGHRHGHDESVH